MRCCNVNVLTELTRKVDVLQRDVNDLKELTELTKKVIRLQHVQLKKADRSRRNANALTKKVDSFQRNIVVIRMKKAAETGSLLTHFICLVLGLLSIKQMERIV